VSLGEGNACERSSRGHALTLRAYGATNRGDLSIIDAEVVGKGR
jgi:hypothetical protein